MNKTSAIVVSFFLTWSCFAVTNTTKQVVVLNYDDFGLQCQAFAIIGFMWYQWFPCGDCHAPETNAIKVVVYKDISLGMVSNLFPVVQAKDQDYRYLEYSKAMEYLSQMEQDAPEMKSLWEKTRKRIIVSLGEKATQQSSRGDSTNRADAVRGTPQK